MKIISNRSRERIEAYLLSFDGYGFDCDAEGNVDLDKLSDAAKANYQRRLDSGEAGEVLDLSRNHTRPAIGQCNHCRREVELSGFTNTCDCGADYNMSGQELAPREQWGWDTGESVADILAVDSHSEQTDW